MTEERPSAPWDPYRKLLHECRKEADGKELWPDEARKRVHNFLIDELLQHALGKRPLSTDIAFNLSEALRGLLEGRHSNLIFADAIGRVGHSPKSHMKQACEEAAIQYFVAWHHGRIWEADPVQAVRNAFGKKISKDTVWRWKRRAKSSKLNPDALPVQIVLKSLEHYGAYYAQHFKSKL